MSLLFKLKCLISSLYPLTFLFRISQDAYQCVERKINNDDTTYKQLAQKSYNYYYPSNNMQFSCYNCYYNPVLYMNLPCQHCTYCDHCVQGKIMCIHCYGTILQFMPLYQ